MLAYVTIGTNDKSRIPFTPSYWANWAQNSFQQ